MSKSIKYLIRLDDACPTMNHKKWQRVEDILDKYNVKPMVGVIPQNEDPKQIIDDYDEGFWLKVKEWEKKGWAVALHGYNHCYNSNEGLKGLNPLWSRSEFAGLKIEEQKEKISKGVAIMKDNGIEPKYFFAPSHTYDSNTLKALESETQIRIISDTIGCHPYRENGFTFIPVLGGKCSERYLSGEWTFCLHPNTMSESAFTDLESFICKHSEVFVSFSDLLNNPVGKKDSISRVLSWSYFMYRKIRHIK